MLGYKQVDKNTPHHPDFRLTYLEIAQNSHIFQGAVSTKQMVGELRIALDTTSYLHCRNFGDYPAPYNGRSASLAMPSGCPTNGSTSARGEFSWSYLGNFMATDNGTIKWYYIGIMSRRLIHGLLLGCAVSLAACGTTTALPTSWVAESISGQFDSFIQWVPNGNGSRFTGSFIFSAISSSGQHLNTVTANITGIVSGGNIEITMDGKQLTGTISPFALTIGFPTTGGSIHHLSFAPGTQQSYNFVLGKLKAIIASNQASYQRQQQLATDQSTVQSDASTVASDISTLQSDVSQLQTDVQSIASDLSQEKSDLGTTQSDFATTKQAVQQYGTGSGNGVCSDAGNVSSDAGSVQSDAGSVSSDVSSVQSDISNLQSDERQLHADETTLAHAEQAVPGYQPSGTPSAAAVKAAIAQAQTAITQAVGTTNTYISIANSYQEQAISIADQASSIGNCGPGPSQPQQLLPIG